MHWCNVLFTAFLFVTIFFLIFFTAEKLGLKSDTNKHKFLFAFMLYFVACTVCTGFIYRGYCLRSAGGFAGDVPTVPGCIPVTPNLSWNYTDYIAICNYFSSSSTVCSNVDFDFNGGRCNNYPALLAFEENSSPDVWVASNVFTWRPSTALSTDCQLLSDTGTVVYMCQFTGGVNPTDAPTIPPGRCDVLMCSFKYSKRGNFWWFYFR